jgi:Lar family restriction alleviation protein
MANDEKVKAEAAALLPCPFCGSRKVKLMTGSTTECYVYLEHDFIACENCHAQSGSVRGGKKKARREMLTTAWNTRHLADTASFERGKAEGIEMAAKTAETHFTCDCPPSHAKAGLHEMNCDILVGEIIAASIRGLLGGEGDGEE